MFVGIPIQWDFILAVASAKAILKWLFVHLILYTSNIDVIHLLS